MKVLTAAQMREVDARTIEAGTPGLELMENAAGCVVEVIEREFSPLSDQRVVVLCGKGNNGGDGLAIARLLFNGMRPASLDVVLAADPETLSGDAAANFEMLKATGCPIGRQITGSMRKATLVVDALLGTGITGAARGAALELIREINTGFEEARVVAVDIPSGIASDWAEIPGEAARADFTVTFTAPKVAHVLPPACDRMGELHVGDIGSPPSLYEDDPSIQLALSGPEVFGHLLGPRDPGAHKGDFGHVLVVAGSRGKAGAAAMSGGAALRAGAGLVTVATATSALDTVAAQRPEIMTEPMPETDTGGISPQAFDYGRVEAVLSGKTVLAVGPGIGSHPESFAFVRRLIAECELPMVVDADGLNAIAASGEPFRAKGFTVLTPHPGEMARLTGLTTSQVLADRVEIARRYAAETGAHLVLKGQRTLIALPGGLVWVNPTGSPAMATGGSGDILTGLIAGMLAQFPGQAEQAILAAVWLHGRSGELGAADIGEMPLIATDLLGYLPVAIEDAVDHAL